MTARNFVKDFGGDGQTIILLHGFLTSSKYWTKLRPMLSRAGYRVVTIDLLGFGMAPKPHGASYSYDEHLHHIHQAICSLGLDRPFILIGHSMGALLAARYNQLYSDAVDSLVLLHPPMYRSKSQARRTIRNTATYRFLLDSRAGRIIWELLRRSRPWIISNHTHDAREKSLRNIIETATFMGELEQIDTKTLLLLGLRDRQVYQENLHSAQLPLAVDVRVEDVGHNSPVSRPSLVYNHIVQFIG